MNKSRLISFIAAGLLLSNLALVAFIFLAPHPRPEHNGPRDIIIERLHFDQKQIEEYDKLIDAHRKAITEQEGNMMQLKNRLYGNLVNGENSLNDSLETAIGNIQIQIEKINYNHFSDIAQLCKPDQKQNFNELVKNIAELFGRPIRRPPGR